MIETQKKSDKILDKTRVSLCKQNCKQRDFFANGADLIDRNKITVEILFCLMST